MPEGRFCVRIPGAGKDQRDRRGCYHNSTLSSMSKNLLRSIADSAKEVDLECPVVALLISLRDIFEAIRKAYVASPVSRRYQKDWNHTTIYATAAPALTVHSEDFKIKSFTPCERDKLRPASRRGEEMPSTIEEQEKAENCLTEIFVKNLCCEEPQWQSQKEDRVTPRPAPDALTIIWSCPPQAIVRTATRRYPPMRCAQSAVITWAGS